VRRLDDRGPRALVSATDPVRLCSHSAMTSLPPEEPLADPLADPLPAVDRIPVELPTPPRGTPVPEDKIEGY